MRSVDLDIDRNKCRQTSRPVVGANIQTCCYFKVSSCSYILLLDNLCLYYSCTLRFGSSLPHYADYSLSYSISFHDCLNFFLHEDLPQTSTSSRASFKPFSPRQPNGGGTPLNIARYKKTVSSIAWVQLALVICYLSGIIFLPEYNKGEKRWNAEYPWIRDPSELPDNKKAAMGMLISTERRLAKNARHAEVYQKQIEDMIDREVARRFSKKELEEYKGPIHYISHHEVLKPDSKSTPVRIVFNSSARYMGHTLNDYWAKGPHLLNDLLGILIRFRGNQIALIGDIKKMYHAVKTKTIEQHTHRFLWRDMDTEKQPDTYVIQRVSFGDNPSGTIATIALRKTAEMGQDKYPKAAQVIKENTYMDDIIESVSDKEKAKKLAKDIENLLEEGSFKMKEWIFTHDDTDQTKTLTVPNDASTATEQVLGVVWNPMQDEFGYKVKLKTAAKNNKKTRV